MEHQVYANIQNKTNKLNLCLVNVTKKYILGMDHVDMASQLRNHYQFDHFCVTLSGGIHFLVGFEVFLVS